MAYSSVSYVITTGASTFPVPADFNPSDNRITCIGSGGGGSARRAFNLGGGGGGGGACAFSTNVNIAAGSTVDVQVGAAGSTTLTWIKDAVGGTIQVQADFGITATATVATFAGGQVANCIGGTKYAGGDSQNSTGLQGRGGGGAAGLSGAGGAAVTSTGGSADNATLAGSAAGSNGGNGTEWDSTHGSGSGAGGGLNANNGKIGGSYGGAGSGGGAAAGVTNGGAGFQGIIVVEYNPVVAFIARLPYLVQQAVNTASTY